MSRPGAHHGTLQLLDSFDGALLVGRVLLHHGSSLEPRGEVQHATHELHSHNRGPSGRHELDSIQRRASSLIS